jgi:ABC-2 type transport system ATP-binding protein
VTPAISLHALSKRFGAIAAVDAVTFDVQPGEIFGFMGHNGAGKTTTLRMLLGLTRPSAGTATVLGHDIVRHTLDVRRVAGFLPAEYALPPDMSPLQFLHYVGAMFGLPASICESRASGLLDQFGMADVAHRKLRGFSSGMTQKVGLMQALINEPKILLLDEPTSGLDPLGRYDLLELLRSLSVERGVTVMFSSHILSDVETLCTRVAALHHGRLIACGDINDLKVAHGARTMDDLYLALVRKAAA